MGDNNRRENEKQHEGRLFNELLDNIDRQLEIDAKLKENMELLFSHTSISSKNYQIREKVETLKSLYIEAEELQAEGRAIFHRLFGTEFEY